MGVLLVSPVLSRIVLSQSDERFGHIHGIGADSTRRVGTDQASTRFVGAVSPI